LIGIRLVPGAHIELAELESYSFEALIDLESFFEVRDRTANVSSIAESEAHADAYADVRLVQTGALFEGLDHLGLLPELLVAIGNLPVRLRYWLLTEGPLQGFNSLFMTAETDQRLTTSSVGFGVVGYLSDQDVEMLEGLVETSEAKQNTSEMKT
jgi:hypothetical protein